MLEQWSKPDLRPQEIKINKLGCMSVSIKMEKGYTFKICSIVSKTISLESDQGFFFFPLRLLTCALIVKKKDISQEQVLKIMLFLTVIFKDNLKKKVEKLGVITIDRT